MADLDNPRGADSQSAASRLIGTLAECSEERPDESGHGTHECVRHIPTEAL